MVGSRSARHDTESARSVLWLGTGDPPPALAQHLERQGFRIGASQAGSSWPCARITALGTRSVGQTTGPELGGRRVAVLHADPGEADLLAQALRARGAHAMVLGLRPERLHRLEAFEPDAVVVDGHSFYGPGWEVVRALWEHVQLRWLPMVLWPSEAGSRGTFRRNDIVRLGATLRSVLSSWDEVRASALTGTSFELPLQALGTLRTLRALLRSGQSLQATFLADGMRVELDIASQHVVAMRGRSVQGGADRVLDREAMGWLLEREQGTIQVEAARRKISASEGNYAADSIWSPVTSGVRATVPPRDSDLEPTTVHRTGSSERPLARATSRSSVPPPVEKSRASLLPTSEPPAAPAVAPLPSIRPGSAPSPQLPVAKVGARSVVFAVIIGALAGTALLAALGFPVKAAALRGAHLLMESVTKILHWA